MMTAMNKLPAMHIHSYLVGNILRPINSMVFFLTMNDLIDPYISTNSQY